MLDVAPGAPRRRGLHAALRGRDRLGRFPAPEAHRVAGRATTNQGFPTPPPEMSGPSPWLLEGGIAQYRRTGVPARLVRCRDTVHPRATTTGAVAWTALSSAHASPSAPAGPHIP